MEEKPQIIVIDDDDVIRMACELALKREGMDVDSASNGKDGLEKIKQKQYDLVLLDLMMPEMSGNQILEAIQKLDQKIIVIVITGFATITSAVETLQQGAYDYIPKPFTAEELRNVVRKGLGRRKLLIEAENLRLEREQNLMKLAAEQSRLSTIINCMAEGLIATDKNARLILINPVACRLLNIEEPYQIGKAIKGYLNSPELENLIHQTLNEKSIVEQKFLTREVVFDEQEDKTYFVTLAPIVEKKNELSGIALVLRDISEEKKLERMKADFQKLVSVVAHELKAPINAIDGYLDIILKGYVEDKPDKRLEYLTRSRDKAEMLRHLVEDLLSLTSIESGKLTRQMEPVDIKSILIDISTFMENEATKKQLKIVQEFPEKIPQITGDKNALTYLFSNFLSNAIKYNKEGGQVNIKIDTKENYLVVSFIDTGFGISKEDLAKIFNEFFRSKNKEIQQISGTGLGLSIAKRIAELHDGRIEVKSELNQGSQFDVYLPMLNVRCET